MVSGVVVKKIASVFVVGSGLVSSSLDNESLSSMIVVAFLRGMFKEGAIKSGVVVLSRERERIKRCRRRFHDWIFGGSKQSRWHSSSRW